MRRGGPIFGSPPGGGPRITENYTKILSKLLYRRNKKDSIMEYNMILI